MAHHCFGCGRVIADTDKPINVMVVESASGRLGQARLHTCCQPGLVRYRHVVEWVGQVGNITTFKQLHHRLAIRNHATWDSVPVVLV